VLLVRRRKICSYRRQTSVFDARYQGIARIEYPLHPLFGREGKVVRRVRYDFGTCHEVEIDEAIVNLPHWMTRADLCERSGGPNSLHDWGSF
jgi:hypothetical protein